MHNVPFSHAYDSPPHDSGDSSYAAPLLDADQPRRRRRRLRPTVMIMMFVTGLGFGLIAMAALLSGYNNGDRETLPRGSGPPENSTALRGVREGVSAKNFRPAMGKSPYPWTDKMLSWQRTAFHFQPKKNWMNGLIYFLHLFYIICCTGFIYIFSKIIKST